jgi:hypothetical protein
MKIWSVLVAFVVVGLVAPQQVEASSFVQMEGLTTLTFNSSNGRNTLNLSTAGITSDHATGLFSPLVVGGGNDTSSLMPITWTGSGPGTVLVGAPIIQEWTASGGMFTYRFDLKSLTATSFEPGSDLELTGKGTVFVFHNGQMSPPIPATIEYFSNDVLPPLGEPFIFDARTTVSTPDSGSALGLLAIGLVALEGLRRKIATRQNRYA